MAQTKFVYLDVCALSRPFDDQNQMRIADAAHLTFAEQAMADFVTVDDRLLKKAARLSLPIWFGSPLAYCEKEKLQ